MVPMHYQWLDSFPLAPSGKRDDRSLRERALGPIPLRRNEGTGLVGTYEQAVAEIMAEFTGSAGFEADTDFFDAGGASIGAMRVVMAIGRRWDVEIPLDAFVAAPTPAHIASLIAAGGPLKPFEPRVVGLRTVRAMALAVPGSSDGWECVVLSQSCQTPSPRISRSTRCRQQVSSPAPCRCERWPSWRRHISRNPQGATNGAVLHRRVVLRRLRRG